MLAALTYIFYLVSVRPSSPSWIHDGLEYLGAYFPSFTVDSFIGTQDAWSSVGDLLNFIFGIPTALAGSIVAILLAQKAYDLSRAQSELESRNYVEGKVNEVVEHYWSLGMSLNDVDRLLDAYVTASVIEAGVINAYKEFSVADRKESNSEKNIEQAKVERLKIEAEFWSAIENVGVSLRSFYRSRLAMSLWESKSPTTNASIQNLGPETLNLLPAFESSKQAPPKLEGCQNISNLANHFMQPLGFTHRDATPAWLLAAFLSQNEIRPDIERYKSEIADHKDTIKTGKGVATVDGVEDEDIIWHPSPTDTITAEWKRLDAFIAASALREPTIRLKLLGSIISYRTFQAKGLPMMYNDGLLALCSVILNFPDMANQDEQLKATVSELEMDDTMISKAVENLKQHNIPAYVPSWMVDVAKSLKSGPDVVTYFNVETAGYRKSGIEL